MRKFNFYLAIATFFTCNLAWSAGTPTKFTTDAIQWGKSGSTLNKNLIFDFGLGASNPVLGIDNSTHTLQYNFNDLQFGDGTTGLKQIFANTGSAPFPYLSFNSTDGQWEFSNDGVNTSGIGSGSGSGGGGINLLANPGFESGITQDWSNSGGSFAVVTTGSGLLIGKKSASFTASSSGQQFKSGIHVVPNGLGGGFCSASILYLGGDPNLFLHATNGSGTDLGTPVGLPVVTNPTISQPVQFPCVAGANVQLNVESTGSAAITYFDQAFLGQNSTFSVSQSQLYATTVFGAQTGCGWDQAATSWTNYGTIASSQCSSVTYTGHSQSQGSNIAPLITLDTAPPGDYYFVVTGSLGPTTVSGTAAYFRFSDGTNVSSSQRFLLTSGNGEFGTMVGHLTESSAHSNLTINIQAQADGGGSAELSASNILGQNLEIAVYYSPSQSQTYQNISQASSFWSGYTMGTCGFSNPNTGTSTPGEFNMSGSTGCHLVQRSNQNMGTVTPYNGDGFNMMPGIVFTPTKVGPKMVCSTGATVSGAASLFAYYQLADESGNILNFQGEFFDNSADHHLVTLCGILPVTSLSPKTVKWLGSSSISTINLESSGTSDPSTIEWQIFDVGSVTQAPIQLGGVQTGNQSGVEAINRVQWGGASVLGTNCTSTPCTIQSESGSWVSSVTHVGTGSYQVNFTPGAFSAAPTCSGNAQSNGNNILAPIVFPAGSSSVAVVIYQAGTFTAVDGEAGIICMGPK